jgi:haloacetate dehalogenase
MALDHPTSVSRLAVFDIVRTGEIWSRADAAFALGYWHWAFLAQPTPLPEQMILANPDAFWLSAQRLGLKDDERYPHEVLNAYRAQCADPDSVAAMCEDYRAGATIDRQLDEADRGREIACPLLCLWGARGALPIFYGDVLDVWRPWSPGVTGRGVDASHFLVEDQPQEVAAELTAFFQAA